MILMIFFIFSGLQIHAHGHALDHHDGVGHGLDQSVRDHHGRRRRVLGCFDCGHDDDHEWWNVHHHRHVPVTGYAVSFDDALLFQLRRVHDFDDAKSTILYFYLLFFLAIFTKYQK